MVVAEAWGGCWAWADRWGLELVPLFYLVGELGAVGTAVGVEHVEPSFSISFHSRSRVSRSCYFVNICLALAEVNMK